MHIETVTSSRPEELKSIISVEEKLWPSIDKGIDSSPQQYHAPKSKKRVPTMPKRYLPYQLEGRAGQTKAVKTVKREEVVCKSSGSNGLVFFSSSEPEDDVDVETCDTNNLLDGDRKTVVTLKNQDEMKEPSRRKGAPSSPSPTESTDGKSKLEGGCSPPTSQANTMAFVAILLHALKCRCVVQHFVNHGFYSFP